MEEKRESKFKKGVEGVGNWIKRNKNQIVWACISGLALYDIYQLGQLVGIKKAICEGTSKIEDVFDENGGHTIGVRNTFGAFSDLKCYDQDYTKNVIIPFIESMKN